MCHESRVRRLFPITDLTPRKPLQALAEPSPGAVVPDRTQDLDGAATHLCGLVCLAPILVQDGEALVAERTGVSGRDRRPAVLHETLELLPVATVTKVRLGEAHVGETEILRRVRQVQGGAAQGDGELPGTGGTGLRAGSREKGGRACAAAGIRVVGVEGTKDAFHAPLRKVEGRVGGEACEILVVEGGEKGSQVLPIGQGFVLSFRGIGCIEFDDLLGETVSPCRYMPYIAVDRKFFVKILPL